MSQECTISDKYEGNICWLCGAGNTACAAGGQDLDQFFNYSHRHPWLVAYRAALKEARKCAQK